MEKYEYLFDNNDNTKDKIATLNDIFNKYDTKDTNIPEDNNIKLGSYYEENRNEDNNLNDTLNIDNADLEELKRYSRILHKVQGDLSNNPNNYEGNPSSKQAGKQKVLTTKPVPKYAYQENTHDIDQILSAFISCSILSFITAGIGVSWLLYILMHI